MSFGGWGFLVSAGFLGAVVVDVRRMFDAGEVKGKGFYYMGL